MPLNTGGVQTFVNRELPPGVPGDWAGSNIRASVPVGPWSLVAPPSGTSVGGIGWANPATGICTSYYQPSCFAGFIHREQQAQALQTSGVSVLANVATLQILSGYPVTALSQGDFWALFQGGSSVGNYCYANPTTGALIAGASGAAVTGSNSGGSISGTTLTMPTADQSGSAVAVGQIIAGAGIPPGTYVVSGTAPTWTIANLDGTAISNVSAETIANYGQQQVQWIAMQAVATFASFTATLAAAGGFGPFGSLVVSAVASGTIEVGQWIQSSGTVSVPLTSNLQVIEQVSGTTGGVGTYLVSNTIAVGTGQTFTTYNGQMAKISSWSGVGQA